MRYFLLIYFFVLGTSAVSAQIKFDDYFLPKTMRLDYTHAGDADTSVVYFEQVKEEPFWGGSRKNLIDKFQFGDYMLSVYDSASNTLIYSRGYSSLFWEWRSNEEAKKIKRSYYENVVFPYPKKTVRVEIGERLRNNTFAKHFSMHIDPNDYFIEKGNEYDFQTMKLLDSGEASKKLDIVILPEGYKKEEMQKFENDARRFIEYFFGVSPFKENKNLVNFWAVMAPSVDSGADIPGEGKWVNTLFNTHFYTFRSERYLTTRDMKTVRDVASLVPYDQIYILVNTTKYGGGGIYNYYNLCVSDHNYSREVFTHEFGHAFAALADEYAYDDTPAEELYDLSVEPWQANLTTLVDFDSKWADLVEKGTPIPTPDSLKGKVGAFEGGGYTKKKIYRPMYDCKMRSNNQDEFCPVCYRTVLEMLKFYSE